MLRITVHNSGLKVRFPLCLQDRNVDVPSPVKCFFSPHRPIHRRSSKVTSPRRCQPYYPRAHQSSPWGFLSIYVTSDLRLLGRLPLSVVHAIPQTPVHSLLPGAPGFKFTVSTAQTCWGHLVFRLRQSTVSVYVVRSCVFYFCWTFLCNISWYIWAIRYVLFPSCFSVYYKFCTCNQFK